MGQQSDDVRQRARDRRRRNLELGRRITAFEAGLGGIGELGRFVKNDNLVLSNRLEAIEIAIRRGIVTLDDLRQPGREPSPFDFGLWSAKKPKRIPAVLEAWFEAHQEFVMAAIIGSSMIAIAAWIYLSAGPILLALLGGFFGGWFVAMPLMIAAMAIIALVNSTAPGRYEWRQYQAAKERHEVLVAAKTVLDLESDVKAFLHANGPEFERLTARAFRRNGYRVEEMGGANDGGVDLLVYKDRFHAIVQCKCHGKPVGPAVVRELVGTLSHSKASMAYLATTNGVSESAREWAKGKPIVFLLPDHLIQGRI
jgi:hypothetical protein